MTAPSATRPATVAFIELNSTGTATEGMRLAREHGLRTLLLSDSVDFYRSLPFDATAHADLVVETDCYDVLKVLRCLAGERIVGVVSFDDYHLGVAAATASAMGLPHADLQGIARARFKDETRRATARLPHPVKSHVVDAQECVDYTWAGEWPCVVKPVDDSGSVAVRRCTTPSEVQEALAVVFQRRRNQRGYVPTPAALVEEYVSGPECSLELMRSRQHGWQPLVRVEKHLGPEPYFAEVGHLAVAPARASVAGVEVDAAVRWVEELGLTGPAAHVEYRLDQNGAPRLIEVNPRLGGGGITDLTGLVTGTDPVAVFLNGHLDPAVRPLPVTAGDRPVDAAAVRHLSVREAHAVAISRALLAERMQSSVDITIPTLPGVSDAEHPQRPTSNYGRAGSVCLSGSEQQVRADYAVLEDQLHATCDIRGPVPSKESA